jgi:hypothetical protein
MDNEKVTVYVPSTEEFRRNDNNFTYHAPKNDQAERYTELRDRAKDLAEIILTYCPPSREKSLALTKLEECSMWANASIARNE